MACRAHAARAFAPLALVLLGAQVARGAEAPGAEQGAASQHRQLVHWQYTSAGGYFTCNRTNGTVALPADGQPHEVARCKRGGMQAVRLLCGVAENGSLSALFVNSYGDHYAGVPVSAGCSCVGKGQGCCVGGQQA